jgi:hypothetical protein
MIILAVESSFERGKAFEEFVSILLSRSGYRIINTRIRKSGRELDIQAVSRITDDDLLVECKADTSPLASSPYNKFYGIFEHEAKRSKGKLVGMLISLSGFNGEVLANYEEKEEEDKQRFKIQGQDFVTAVAVDAGLIADDSTVRHLAKKSWPFELGDTLLIITKSQLYRVQLLIREGKATHFVVYRAHCEDPTEYEIESIQRSTSILKNLESFNLMARKELLRSLTRANKELNAKELASVSTQSVMTVDNEVAFLKERRLVTEDKKGLRLNRDIRTFCEVALELLDSDYKYDFLLSPYYRDMNNPNLAEYCLSRRLLEVHDHAELVLLCSIFRFSPSATTHALFADTSIYEKTHEHATAFKKNIDWLPDSLKYSFIRELIPHLLTDLREGNKVMDGLESVVGFLESYHLKLANTWEVLFDIKASGITTRLKAGEDMEAGQLVTIPDPLTRFNLEMTRLNLTGDSNAIDEMIQIYTTLVKTEPTKSELPGLANNIGVCFMAVKEYGKAKEWFNTGLEYHKDIPELQANLEKIEVLVAAST